MQAAKRGLGLANEDLRGGRQSSVVAADVHAYGVQPLVALSQLGGQLAQQRRPGRVEALLLVRVAPGPHEPAELARVRQGAQEHQFGPGGEHERQRARREQREQPRARDPDEVVLPQERRLDVGERIAVGILGRSREAGAESGRC